MERFRGKFNFDSFRNRESMGINELSIEAYLENLTEQDRENVQRFLTLAEELDEDLPFFRIAVTAVGSTTFPEEKRLQPPEDIDLRILNSAPENSLERETAILELQGSMRKQLMEQKLGFTEDHSTGFKRIVEGYSGGKKELLPFVDYYNNDPSFTVQFPEGLPFHISLSGVDNYNLDSYLKKERKDNGHFALLYKS